MAATEGDIRRAAASSDAAAAAVEERHGDAVPPAGGDDGFLRLVQLPAGGQPPDVLRRVRVADHHFLAAVDPRGDTLDCQQAIEHGRRPLQVGRGFEQRDDAQRTGDARILLQQLDGEDVGRLLRSS